MIDPNTPCSVCGKPLGPRARLSGRLIREDIYGRDGMSHRRYLDDLNRNPGYLDEPMHERCDDSFASYKERPCDACGRKLKTWGMFGALFCGDACFAEHFPALQEKRRAEDRARKALLKREARIRYRDPRACEVCGGEMPITSRTDRRTCSIRCRSILHRAKNLRLAAKVAKVAKPKRVKPTEVEDAKVVAAKVAKPVVIDLDLEAAEDLEGVDLEWLAASKAQRRRVEAWNATERGDSKISIRDENGKPTNYDWTRVDAFAVATDATVSFCVTKVRNPDGLWVGFRECNISKLTYGGKVRWDRKAAFKTSRAAVAYAKRISAEERAEIENSAP